MNKEDIIREIGKPILPIIGIAQGVFLLTFFTSPFLWIWVNFDMAAKVGLTGLIGTLLMKGIYYITKKAIDEAVDEFINDNSKGNSKFKDKLERLQKL
jgi:hypothetical protein